MSLSAEQVAALTHDIVWMEEHEVRGEKVLVPVLYLAQAQGRLAPNGALIQGRDVTLISGGSLNNQGTLKASQNLSASAVNLTNSGSMQAGERLSMLATESIRNTQGGIIAGRDVSVKALSGDIINERSVTTFESGASNYTYRKDYVDGAARIEALNDLDLGAGRDVQSIGSGLSAGRDLRIDTRRDLLIVSAEQHDLSTQKNRKGNSRREQITQHGSDVSAGRDLTFSSDRDLAVVASRVKAGEDLAVKSDGNVLIGSAANESHYESHRKSRGKKENIEQSRVTQQGAELIAGGNLSVKAGEDLGVVASQIKAGDEAYLYAGGDLELLAAQNSEYSLYDKKKKGSFGAKKTRRDEVTDVRNVGSQITSGSDLTLASEGDQLYQRARLESGGNLTLDSGGEIAFEAVKDLHQESHEKSKSDLAWNSMKGKGSTDETLLQSQLIAQGEIVIKAVEGLKIDIKQIDQKTVSETVDAMVAADPQLAWLKQVEQRGDVDWRRVKEIHDSFKYSHSGLGAGAQLVIAIVVAYFAGPMLSQGIGSLGGASAAAGSGTAMAASGTATASAVAAGATAGSTVAAGWANVALTAAATGATSNAAISTINNQGNLGAVLKDVTSSDNLKGYATSAITAGFTSGMLDSAFGVKGDNINKVTKGFDLSKASDLAKFGSYLGAQGAVQAIAQTAIQGGSLGGNLQTALTSQMQHLLQAGVFKGVGDFAKDASWADGSPAKIALHAVMGGLLSEATGGDFKTGALAGGANELLIEQLAGVIKGDKGLELMVSQLIGVAAATATGGDPAKAAELAKNATAYNRQLHDDQIKLIQTLSDDPEKQGQLKAALCVMQNCDINGLGGYDANGQAIYEAGIQLRASNPELFAQLKNEINSAGLLSGKFVYNPGGIDFAKDSLGREWNDKTRALGKAWDTAKQKPDDLGDVAKGVAKGLASSVKGGPQYPIDNADEAQGAILANAALVVAPVVKGAGVGSLNAMGRAWERGKVLNAGEIAMSSGGNISAQQVTRVGTPAGLNTKEINALSKLDSLSSGAAGVVRETVSNSYFERNGFKALDGKCGTNCFDGVYIKGNQVIVNEVKPLQANGSIKLSSGNEGTGLKTQMSDEWIKSRIDQLLNSGDPEKVKAGNLILKASRSGNLTTVVSGVNSNGMVIVKVKP
ncbi:DUF637 domain-containing protein [Pseudomonas otitidis]|nr:DUF637 domain-containing protein [Pseudomonas otitidis]MDI6529493.1 DUF637 domain-containing protein [Pseudomonas otitidis]